MAQTVKNLPARQETRVGPLEEEMATHSSILENPMDRGAWWATVQGVLKSQTQLSMHSEEGRTSLKV